MISSFSIDYSPEDDVCHEMKVYGDVIQVSGEPNMVQFSDGELVPVSKLDEATAFYGSKSGYHNNGSRIRPSLATMTSKFRFIKSENHLQKLREYEEKGSIKCNRANNLSFISKELEKIVRKNLEEGKIMHDSTLRFFISDIINKNKIDIKFTASHDWLNKWKRGLGLSSRKITKFVANVRHKSRDQIEKESKEFVAKVNQEMAPYPLSSVFNADQTDGKLHKKLFVTLKEPKGQFPKKGHYKAPNLHVTCHTSHIMTKDLMKEFFKDIVFDSSMPKDALLIVDSWSSWKDSDAIKSVTPRRNKLKVLMIPPGCTGLVQPCDVGIFGGFKKVVKTITGQAQLTHPKIQDNFCFLVTSRENVTNQDARRLHSSVALITDQKSKKETSHEAAIFGPAWKSAEQRKAIEKKESDISTISLPTAPVPSMNAMAPMVPSDMMSSNSEKRNEEWRTWWSHQRQLLIAQNY
uniref:DDE-1 domain-containing protein n=1 Tax=Caenorhabditis tropicalis TaxID=1561998 RepID=A0A1I7USQ9_9PELO